MKDTLITNAESRLLLSELQTQVSQLTGDIQGLQSQISNIPLDTTPTQNPSAVVNQIRNGDYSHSVDSWYDDGASDNSRYECAWWYSHPIQDGQPMFKNTTKTGNATLTLGVVDLGADTITITGHMLLTGTACIFSGSKPSPLLPATVYWVIVVDANTIKVAATYADAIAGTAIDLTVATTGGSLLYNYTLKETAHTLYSDTFSDWDWPTGAARFQGSTDVSCFFPAQNAIQPGYTYYAVGSFVKLNQYITCPVAVRLFAGLYANSTALGGWDWIYGDFDISYEIVGTVTGAGTSRDYLIHVQTNRDFTINSTVLTIANAPTDADFGAGTRVILTWKRVLNFGVNSYDVYRNTAGTYLRLFNVVNSTTYIDNGGFQETVVGYPTADYDKLIAYTSTNSDIVATLPYQGDPLNPNWSPIPFSLKVPQNFDMGDVVLADGVWLRFGFQGAPDRLDLDLPDGNIVDGDKTLTTTSSGQFTADQVGLTIDIYLADDLIFSTTIASYTNANEIEMTDPAPDDGTDRRVYIHEGAPTHCISMDLSHVGFVAGATFAYNPEDMSPDRGVPPVLPNGTSQGGNPGGQPPNTPDGHPVCLWINEMVTLFGGEKIAVEELKIGDKLDNGDGGFNTVVEISEGVSDVWLLVAENGAELLASPTKQVFIRKGVKKVLSTIKKGDKIITEWDEAKEKTNERELRNQIVRQIRLTPKESFLAGGRDITVVVSNRKPLEPIITV